MGGSNMKRRLEDWIAVRDGIASPYCRPRTEYSLYSWTLHIAKPQNMHCTAYSAVWAYNPLVREEPGHCYAVTVHFDAKLIAGVADVFLPPDVANAALAVESEFGPRHLDLSLFLACVEQTHSE